jgi:hypothetical protein
LRNEKILGVIEDEFSAYDYKESHRYQVGD